MMEIEYKVPFLDMLDDLCGQIKTQNKTAIVSMFMEIAEDVEIDAENCDTPTNALANIANVARAASAAIESEIAGGDIRQKSLWGFLNGMNTFPMGMN